MKKITFLGLLMAFAVCMQACNDNQTAKNYNNRTLVDDQGLDFIRTGYEAGLTEIKAAKLAESASKNTKVIDFAKMMVADHSQTGSDMKVLAKNRMVDLSDSLSAKHNTAIDSLGKLTGDAFDKVYMKMMVSDHEQVVTLFEANTTNKTGYVQEFAKKHLPTLKNHLESAKDIYAGLK
jgi:putative membrane protein